MCSRDRHVGICIGIRYIGFQWQESNIICSKGEKSLKLCFKFTELESTWYRYRCLCGCWFRQKSSWWSEEWKETEDSIGNGILMLRERRAVPVAVPCMKIARNSCSSSSADGEMHISRWIKMCPSCILFAFRSFRGRKGYYFHMSNESAKYILQKGVLSLKG